MKTSKNLSQNKVSKITLFKRRKVSFFLILDIIPFRKMEETRERILAGIILFFVIIFNLGQLRLIAATTTAAPTLTEEQLNAGCEAIILPKNETAHITPVIKSKNAFAVNFS